MDDRDIGSEGMTSDSVEEWLEEIAEAEGLSREETLEDLVSSYWRLEEIFHLLQDTDIDLDRSKDSPTKREFASESELDELRNQVNRIAREIEDGEPTDETIAELQRAVTSLDTRLETTQNQLSKISDELSGLLESPLAEADDIADRLTTLERRMNRLESSVSEVDSRLDDLAESAISEAQFDAYAREVGSAQETLQNEHRSLRDFVKNEFGNIRTVLTYLLETSGDDNEGSPLVDREFEDDVRKHLEEQAILASILRTASRAGIRKAECANCGRGVDLSLLENPFCPNCERAFEGLESSSQYWGLTQRHELALAEDSIEVT